jgi:hypothetical protein
MPSGTIPSYVPPDMRASVMTAVLLLLLATPGASLASGRPGDHLPAFLRDQL